MKPSDYEDLQAQVETLKGDLQLMKLSRDAKLCSECPRTGELAELRAALKHFGRHPRGQYLDDTCPAVRLEPPEYRHYGRCTCGLDAALSLPGGKTV